jgi:hypothetical protein
LGFALSAEMQRALVALYHQSQSFIIPEKLDKAIDCMFADVANIRKKVVRYREVRYR